MLAVVRPPGAHLMAGERTYIDRQSIDFEAAQREHAQYCRALRGVGCAVMRLPALDEQPDAVFVEDSAVVFSEAVALCAPGANSRACEPEQNAPHFSRLRPVLRPPPEVRLDGGDVLQTERYVFVGLSTRTNEAALDYLQMATSKLVVPVELTGSLHLKSALTTLGENVFVVNPAWVDQREIRSRIPSARFVEVPPEMPFAANVLRINWAVLVSQRFDALEAKIQELGLRQLNVPLIEFHKAEAGLTCLSVIIS